MVRDRQWRRQQNKKILKQTLKKFNQRYDYLGEQINNPYRSAYLHFRYNHRLSITEVVEIFVDGEETFEKYKLMESRKLRDNRKDCNCCACRSWFRDHNLWRDLSLQEKRHYVDKNMRKKIPFCD